MTGAELEEKAFERFCFAFKDVPGVAYQNRAEDTARSGARFLSFSYDDAKSLLVFGSRGNLWTRLFIQPEHRHKGLLERVFADVLGVSKRLGDLLYFMPQPFELKSRPTDLLLVKPADYIFDRTAESVEALTKLYLRVTKKLGFRLERCNRLGENMLRYWP